MTSRQQVGVRKSHAAMHKRGIERRRQLLQAARRAGIGYLAYYLDGVKPV
jgi:undecaprenyl pyrophosphate synthase